MKQKESKVTTKVTISKEDLKKLKRVAEIQTESTEAVIKAIIRIVINNKYNL